MAFLEYQKNAAVAKTEEEIEAIKKEKCRASQHKYYSKCMAQGIKMHPKRRKSNTTW